MKVEIWSDVVCPWCYIGKRRFEKALERFAHRDQVEVVWRSFELDPKAPRETQGDLVGHLASKYGRSRAEAQGMIDHVATTAARDGLKYNFAAARGGNTFDAHRLIHLADKHGKQGAMKERLLAAYFTEGKPIAERDTLAALAADVGIDAGEARTALEGDAYAEDVRADERRARAIGIQGVPFFVIAGKYAVSGAQPVELLQRALEQAWTETASEVSEKSGEESRGEDCADGACKV